MLQLHLSDQHFYCLLRCVLYEIFDGNVCIAFHSQTVSNTCNVMGLVCDWMNFGSFAANTKLLFIHTCTCHIKVAHLYKIATRKLRWIIFIFLYILLFMADFADVSTCMYYVGQRILFKQCWHATVLMRKWEMWWENVNYSWTRTFGTRNTSKQV